MESSVILYSESLEDLLFVLHIARDVLASTSISIERTCPIFEEEKKTCKTSNVSCKTIWWNKCKWIRNIWIVFQLKLMGLNVKGVKCLGERVWQGGKWHLFCFHQSWTLEKWPNTLNVASFRFSLKSNDGDPEWDDNTQIQFIALSGSDYNVGIRHGHYAILQKHLLLKIHDFPIVMMLKVCFFPTQYVVFSLTLSAPHLFPLSNWTGSDLNRKYGDTECSHT